MYNGIIDIIDDIRPSKNKNDPIESDPNAKQELSNLRFMVKSLLEDTRPIDTSFIQDKG